MLGGRAELGAAAGPLVLFAGFVSRRDRHDLDADVVMFFALTNALLDAAIETLHVKRGYDYCGRSPRSGSCSPAGGSGVGRSGRDGELIEAGSGSPTRRRRS